MSKCSCYYTEEKTSYPFGDMFPMKETIGRCNGTREQDQCLCGGDPAKCDFYPKKREFASRDITKDLVEALRLCVKHNKPYDALSNCEMAADRLEQLENEKIKLLEQLHDSYTEHLLCIVIPKLEEEIKELKDRLSE